MLMHTHCCRRVSVYVYVSVCQSTMVKLKEPVKNVASYPPFPYMSARKLCRITSRMCGRAERQRLTLEGECVPNVLSVTHLITRFS